MARVYSILGAVACLILGLDQWTKQIAIETLDFEGQSKPFTSWWSWTMVHNEAAAFGVFSRLPFVTNEAVRIGFLLLVPIIVLGALWKYHVLDFKPKEIFRPAVTGLVVGGAIGNFIDRLRFGHVIDFIDWFYPSITGKCLPLFFRGSEGTVCHWPVFNVADSAITAAIILFFGEWLVPKLVKPFKTSSLPE